MSSMLKYVKYSFLLCGLFLFIGITGYGQNKTDSFVVVLDAGHGGHDPGNRGNGYKEKEIALKVVLAVGEALEKNPDFKVIYTRKSDTFIELFERGKIANDSKADLFVSIHCNSHSTQAHGTETFVLGLNANNKNFEVAKNENSVILLEDNYEANYDGFDPNSPGSIIGLTLMQEEYLDQSLNLASFVQDRFTKNLKRKSRGVKQAGFIVLHQTYMPSVLIELGFLTNDKEGKYLNGKKGQTAMANSITKSILSYKESLDANYSIPDVEEVEEVLKEEIATEIKKDDAVISDIVMNEGSEQPETNEITFRVQIAAGSTDIPLDPQNFNGLSDITKLKIGDVYKYFYGQKNSYDEIKKLQVIAVDNGFTSSFITAFKKGEQVALSEIPIVVDPVNE